MLKGLRSELGDQEDSCLGGKDWQLIKKERKD